MTEIERKKCNRCKVNLTFDKFKKKRDDSYQKLCIECNEKGVQNKNKSKCEHGRRKTRCKDCGGGSICEHNRQKSHCKECGGASICEHNRIKSTCKECGGSQICEHDRRRSQCKDCGGGSICEHDRRKSQCKECGGSQFCEHNRIRSICKECGGGSICEHDRQKSTCKDCNFPSYLSQIIRNRIRNSLKSDKELSSKEYLGCEIDEFKTHIEKTFEEGMNWDNYGEWHIDHITPIKYKEEGKVADLEEVIKRLHYTNTQALWASDNIAKGNRFIGK
jgi:hypothetical protein